MTSAPVPRSTRPRGGRPFNVSSPLGKLMAHRGLSVREMSDAATINERTISNLLARRVAMSADNAQKLSAALNVAPAALTNYALVDVDPEGVQQAQVVASTPSVKSLLSIVRNAS